MKLEEMTLSELYGESDDYASNPDAHSDRGSKARAIMRASIIQTREQAVMAGECREPNDYETVIARAQSSGNEMRAAVAKQRWLAMRKSVTPSQTVVDELREKIAEAESQGALGTAAALKTRLLRELRG